MSRVIVLVEGKLPEKYSGMKFAGILPYGRECSNGQGKCYTMKEASKEASPMRVRHLGIRVSGKKTLQKQHNQSK